MTSSQPNPLPDCSQAAPDAIREQLARIVQSGSFAGSARLRSLLTYLVEQSLEGRSKQLKEYTLAVEVFRRPASFDPRLDPIVRVQASNLRAKLKDYYAGVGGNDPVRITLPRGTYIPDFACRPDSARPSVRTPELASVAVLPCVDLSTTRDQEPFCDGITEEIINALAKLEGLRVVGRTSVFCFKGQQQDVRVIGAQLGVQAILETSLRRDQSDLRVTAHLTDVTSGFTLWSKVFDFKLENVFDVQEEIAESIAKALRVSDSASGLVQGRSRDAETYDPYLLARFYLNKRNVPSLRRGIGIFSDLLAQDPMNARALSGLAESHFLLGMAGVVPPSEAMPKAAELAASALSIDPDLPDALATLASVRALYEWNWDAAGRGFRRALELSPSHPTARIFYAFTYLLPMGQGEEAVEQLREAVRVDPLSLAANQMLAFALYAMRRYDEAVPQCGTSIELDTGSARAYGLKALALANAGSHREAMRAADLAVRLCDDESSAAILAAAVAVYSLAGKKSRALALLKGMKGSKRTEPGYWQALATASVGREQTALRQLAAAFHTRDPWLVSLIYEPLADPLRSNKHFLSMLRRFGLPPRTGETNSNS